MLPVLGSFGASNTNGWRGAGNLCAEQNEVYFKFVPGRSASLRYDFSPSYQPEDFFLQIIPNPDSKIILADEQENYDRSSTAIHLS